MHASEVVLGFNMVFGARALLHVLFELLDIPVVLACVVPVDTLVPVVVIVVHLVDQSRYSLIVAVLEGQLGNSCSRVRPLQKLGDNHGDPRHQFIKRLCLEIIGELKPDNGVELSVHLVEPLHGDHVHHREVHLVALCSRVEPFRDTVGGGQVLGNMQANLSKN